MKQLMFVFALCFGDPVFAQVSWNNVPVHQVTAPRSRHTGFGTPASIDPDLWSDYLNWSLFLDSTKRNAIPEGIYKIHTQFMVDTAGRIALAKALGNPFGLGDTVQKRIIAFPYKWSPATQNGRPVKSYHRIILEFDLRTEKH
ncbi:hypothetical protein LQ567_15495 [Niabella pedocola]|uniref:TonB C-terminal domain-containing protein n=1 Tax=Niabella pedocola TaxID=1752077 RepID=A0ABS8PSZ0_9BACT|nr:hypothetical protein [Niabella pedocola]MCD2424184.1 hypothetical protein [Niabella pedocola]